MARFGNRCKETTDTTGTGTLDLNGAPTGFRGFGDEFTSGNDEISYLIVDDPDNPTEYEYGKGTFTSGTPDTFARDTVEGSSNSGNKVSWTAGTKTIIATPTAADFAALAGDGSWSNKLAIVRSITGDDNQVAADDGKLILADGSGNSPAGLTYTLLAAATAGDGFVVTIKNVGSSGSVIIDGNGSETIDGETTFTLDDQYDFVVLRCDGTDWHVVARFADEVDAASDTAAGIIEIADKAEMESASSSTLAVPPGRVQNHPGVAKAWISFDGSAATIGTGDASYNMDAVTDNGTGDYTINFTTDFSSVAYVMVAAVDLLTGANRNAHIANIHTKAAGTCRVLTHDTAGAAANLEVVDLAFFGDQ